MKTIHFILHTILERKKSKQKNNDYLGIDNNIEITSGAARKKIITFTISSNLCHSHLFCVCRHHAGEDGAKWKCPCQLLPESERSSAQDCGNSHMVGGVLVCSVVCRV